MLLGGFTSPICFPEYVRLRSYHDMLLKLDNSSLFVFLRDSNWKIRVAFMFHLSNMFFRLRPFAMISLVSDTNTKIQTKMSPLIMYKRSIRE